MNDIIIVECSINVNISIVIVYFVNINLCFSKSLVVLRFCWRLRVTFYKEVGPLWGHSYRYLVEYFFRLQFSVNESGTAVWILYGSLFSQLLSMAISWTHISHGSIATCLRCGGIFSNHFNANLLLNQLVKEFWKLVKILWSYRHEFCDFLIFGNTV